MTWEQKLAAMKSLVGDFNIRLAMREPGDWYVECRGREIGGNGMLSGSYGNGSSPELAVLDDWRQLVDELPVNRYIVLSATGKDRKHLRWNGFMWRDLLVEQTVESA